MEIALKIPGDDRLSAIVIAAGMLRQIRTINDGGTPVADAMDAIMEDSLTC